MSEFPDVSVTALPDDAVVLDIREQDEWDRGHAPTAVHIPMSELPARVDELAPVLDADEPLVITCRSGGRVHRVTAGRWRPAEPVRDQRDFRGAHPRGRRPRRPGGGKADGDGRRQRAAGAVSR